MKICQIWSHWSQTFQRRYKGMPPKNQICRPHLCQNFWSVKKSHWSETDFSFEVVFCSTLNHPISKNPPQTDSDSYKTYFVIILFDRHWMMQKMRQFHLVYLTLRWIDSRVDVLQWPILKCHTIIVKKLRGLGKHLFSKNESREI